MLLQGCSTLPTGVIYRYTSVVELPKFPGGDKALATFLVRTLKYPPDARDSRITGRVTLKFLVVGDGSLKNIGVAVAVHPLLDQEAVRVFRNSPKWNPSRQRGVPVTTAYRLPLSFQLGGF